MSLTEVVDGMMRDIHVAQKKAHRLKATARRLQEAVDFHMDMHFEIFKILEDEGIILEKDEDIPAKLKELIAKLKEPPDATS